LKKPELNLVEASGALDLQEAFEKSSWQKISEVSIPAEARCELCNQAIKLQVVIKNLQNGLILKIGTQCYQKVVNFMRTGKFEPIPKPTASSRSAGEELNKLAVLDETYLGWFDAQDLPDDLRREIEYIKVAKVPTSMEKVKELLAYYRQNRIFEPEILIPVSVRVEAESEGLHYHPMTLAAYDLWLKDLQRSVRPRAKPILIEDGWYSFSVWKDGSRFSVKICPIEAPGSVGFNERFREALEQTASIHVMFDRSAEGAFVSEDYLEEWKTRAKESVDKYIRAKLSIVDYLNNNLASFWYVNFSSGQKALVVGEKGSTRFILLKYVKEENPLHHKVYRSTILKPLHGYYCEITDQIRLTKEDDEAWKKRADSLIKSEQTKLESAFSKYDVTFSCPSELPRPKIFISVPKLSIWIYRRRLKLVDIQPSGDWCYDHFSATVSLKVPTDMIENLTGRNGKSLEIITKELAESFSVQNLKVVLVPC
jgi:hypothetical protein